MIKNQKETIERLRHWLDLAEGDNAIGDRDSLSSKLMLIRAEVENALNLRRVPAEEPVVDRIVRYRLNIKYAMAAVLLVVALFVSVNAILKTNYDRSYIARNSDTSTIEDSNVAPFNEGSEDNGSTLVFSLPDVVSKPIEKTPLGVDSQLVAKAPEGRKGTPNGRKNGAGGRELIYTSDNAAAEIRLHDSSPPANASSAQVETTDQHEQKSIATDNQSIEGTQTVTLIGKPKLDPLSLIATLDAHFNEP